MIIAGEYSFNGGKEYIQQYYPHLLSEIYEVIGNVDARQHKTKESKEARRSYQMLYSPPSLNKAFKTGFGTRGWVNRRVRCDYPTQFYTPGYQTSVKMDGSFRDMDFVKEKLGVEVQFGKYSFMVYNVCAKMTIFKNLGHIDAGVEIVPVKQLVNAMSSGVSFFEQFIWDLEQRGVSNIDIPPKS
ncbi:MAG: restriction endonuclease [Methylacidiphilales bacterium]|nr:restriction endonuclease [Candidatus Methylacidiphilales bacterium]NJR16052.1 restriction endonuclease [Calothrix sp. CSU_2_0]